MTSDDLKLDQNVFRSSDLIKLYRIVRAKYANLSGVGATRYPGRWNQPGEEAIYTSTSRSTPVLERLVHTPKDRIPINLAMMEIHLDLKAISAEEIKQNEKHPSTHDWFCIFPTLRFAREHYPGILWTAYSSLLALAVPSVVVPEWNVVLYPQCPSFWKHVTLVSVEPFEFDPRLFPENTPVELP